MYAPSNYKAFTLIELLITMSIAALLMALVGPLTMNQIDSSNSRAEVEKLKDVIRSVSTKAFSSGNSIEVNVEDDALSIRFNALNTKVEFTYISFPSQTIFFNSNGYPDKVALSYQYKDGSRDINIHDVLGAKSSNVIILP